MLLSKNPQKKVENKTTNNLDEQRQFGAWGVVDYFSKGFQKSIFNHEMVD